MGSFMGALLLMSLLLMSLPRVVIVGASLIGCGSVEVEYFGENVPAVVAEEPLFDPTMTRLRA